MQLLHCSGACPAGADARARPSPALACICSGRCSGAWPAGGPWARSHDASGGGCAWLRDASWDLRPALGCSERTRCPQESGAQAQVSGARVQVPGPRAAAWASVLHPPRPPTLASPRLRTRGRAAGWEAPTPRDRDPRGPALHTLSRAGRTLLCATGLMTAFWAGPLSTSAGGPCSQELTPQPAGQIWPTACRCK